MRRFALAWNEGEYDDATIRAATDYPRYKHTRYIHKFIRGHSDLKYLMENECD